MRKLAIAILIFIFFSILSTTAFSQVIHQGQVVEEKKPVDFHIIPAVGAGIFLEDSQTKSVSNNGFFIVRVPGLILPRFSVGMQIELTKAPTVEYSIANYARINFTDHVSAGANVRFWRGGGEGSIEYAPKITPVIGFRLLTVAGRVPLVLEAEFLDDQSPVKVALIVTWGGN